MWTPKLQGKMDAPWEAECRGGGRQKRERNHQDVSFVLTPEERKSIEGVAQVKDGAYWSWSGQIDTDKN